MIQYLKWTGYTLVSCLAFMQSTSAQTSIGSTSFDPNVALQIDNATAGLTEALKITGLPAGSAADKILVIDTDGNAGSVPFADFNVQNLATDNLTQDAEARTYNTGGQQLSFQNAGAGLLTLHADRAVVGTELPPAPIVPPDFGVTDISGDSRSIVEARTGGGSAFTASIMSTPTQSMVITAHEHLGQGSRVDLNATTDFAEIFGRHFTTGNSIKLLARSSGASIEVETPSTGARAPSIFFTNGMIGIGTPGPDQTFTVNGDASKNTGGTAWQVFSDRRLKEDIQAFTDGLPQLMQIQPVTFRYNGKGPFDATGKTEVGIIAQDLQKVAPYMIDSFEAKLTEQDAEPTDILRYNGNAMTYILINAVQEQQAIIDQQNARLAALEAKLDRLSEAMPVKAAY